MIKLSKLAETMIGSEIVRLGNEINERKRQGEEIFNFTIGDFNPKIFPIPEALEIYIIESYRHNYTNYPPAEGIIDLRKAVAAFIKEWQGLEYATSEILIACGGRPLIYTLFKTVVDENDKVIYGVPSWNNNHYTNIHKGEHCAIETKAENNFMPTAADIAANIKGASLICLCTPQNPTGTTLDKETLTKICDLIIEENNRRGKDDKKLYLMFDQIYWTLTHGSIRHYNPVSINAAMRDYTIFIDGISKAFAATGVRVGWALGPAEVLAKMKAFTSHIGAWAPMAEQHATAKYLIQKESVQHYLTHFKKQLEIRLNKIYNGLKALKKEGFDVDVIAPQAAIYLTVKFDISGKSAKGIQLKTQAEVTEYLLSEARLAVVPFYAFGAANNSHWYRLSVGTCTIDDIDKFLETLRIALQALS